MSKQANKTAIGVFVVGAVVCGRRHYFIRFRQILCEDNNFSSYTYRDR